MELCDKCKQHVDNRGDTPLALAVAGAALHCATKAKIQEILAEVVSINSAGDAEDDLINALRGMMQSLYAHAAFLEQNLIRVCHEAGVDNYESVIAKDKAHATHNGKEEALRERRGCAHCHLGPCDSDGTKTEN